ncbi:hypothetical protein ZIOFF_038192 [Zingiber officinale]|uniref:Uncharacterized protein n=1 Tax=Zingiber officinale TaxID=94328 RepID=A0A8J5L9T7_ZINOF|nr:hypothetical protein ZIOFF_038192 [Zingiber officinale]
MSTSFFDLNLSSSQQITASNEDMYEASIFLKGGKYISIGSGIGNSLHPLALVLWHLLATGTNAIW